MKQELEQQLYDAFPELFKHLEWGFECGDGWFNIIKDLASKLIELPCSWYPGAPPQVSQVKEKFGTLRVYMYGSTTAMDELLDASELTSLTTCEQCGEPGKINLGPWYEVRCTACRTKEDEEETKRKYV